MGDFKEWFYKILLNQENFYMKQYYSDFQKKEVFLAVKNLKDGIYCVLVCDEENEEIDYSEAIKYIKTFEKLFSFNMIILANKEEYIYSNPTPMANKMILNKKNLNVIACDNLCIPLKHLVENNLQIKKENNSKNNGNFFQYKILTSIIMGLNIIIFLLSALMSGNIFDIDSNVLIYLGAKVDFLINNGEAWRLLTCAFLHSGIIHIAVNMYSLYIIGPQIEQIYGIRRYLIIYIISCLTSSLLSYIMSPNALSVGASGAIFGLLGALLAFAIVERNKISRKYISSILQIIIINLFIGLSIKNIDNFAHLGGLIGGLLIGAISYKISRKKVKL